MKVEGIFYKLIHWSKSFIFLTLIAFTSNVYAEYYFVYPAYAVYPAPAVSCPGSCCVKHCYHPPKKIKHKIKHKKPCKTKVKHVKTVVRYVPVMAAPCDGCCYDPDLATGDDNQCLHPDLNIDY